MLEELCRHDWPPRFVSKFAGVLLDIPLDPQQLDRVLQPLLLELPKLPVDETPPFIYQLLLLRCAIGSALPRDWEFNMMLGN